MGDNTLPARRVLVVDDNRDAANSVAALLRLCGQTVQQAYDGYAALRIASHFKPEVVFIDLVMPGMDGFALARQLRELEATRNARLVALTAFGQPAFRDAATESGMDAHLCKPASASELTSTIAMFGS
ncbi:MAG TPA: response regulator [Solimonas sp.]|nr:response regulator [Solimonas sp.]